MHIALLQTDIIEQNTTANLKHLESIFPTNYDMVALPEMFHCGFSKDMSYVTSADGIEALEWMKSAAKSHGCHVLGSVAWKEERTSRNRLYCCSPNGDVDFYDKRHLFSMGNEQKDFEAGNSRKIIEIQGIRIMLEVCYDVRFPVWSRNRGDYDALLYVANWPAARQGVWTALLKARAIENQCFVMGVNCVGTCNNIAYKGGTIVFGPRGEVIAEAKSDKEEIVEAELNLDMLRSFREKFRVLDDADAFSIGDAE